MSRLYNQTVAALMRLDSYDVKQRIDTHATALEASGVAVKDAEGKLDEGLILGAIERDAEDISEIVQAFSTGRLAGEKVTIKELLMTKDYPKLFYAATEILMKSRIVPDRVITSNLFQTIPYAGNALNVTIRTLGGVQVEEVAEGAEYPETSSAVSDQAYRINLEVRKYGAKVSATKELIESDNWGIFAYTVQSLAEELLNKKERLGTTMINELAGYTLMDNANAASVPLGSCTGRGLDGAQNGAMGLDDIMNILAWMQMRGYNMDTILIHPFAWAMWARDPEIREVVLGGNVIYIPQGGAAQGWDPMPWGSFGTPYSKYGSPGGQQITPAAANNGGGTWNAVDPLYGKLGVAPYNWPNLTPFGATFYTQPKFTDRPLKVITSPLVPYYKISGGSKAGKYATNIIFAEANKCGLILQKESPTMEEWNDIEREINFIKIRERYGMALQEQGRAVAIARNIVIDRTYAFDNVHSVTLTNLTTTSNLV